jgi:prepilin-type N-terminal cleavage/methylation domain-containing protein
MSAVHYKNQQEGFTVVELLVVIIASSLLMAVVFSF